MSRELKRVALDFSWTENKIWDGYCNPYYIRQKDCHFCDRSGYSHSAIVMRNELEGGHKFDPYANGRQPYHAHDWHVLARAKINCERKIADFPYTVDSEAKRLAAMWNSKPTCHFSDQDFEDVKDSHRFGTYLWWAKSEAHLEFVGSNEPSPRGLGIYCCLNYEDFNYTLIEKRHERMGILHLCPICDGHGKVWPNPEDKALYEEWKPADPPEGPGYQMWETVSEGSPISPVFETPEELAQYLDINYPSYGNYNQWLKMILGPGWVPSGVYNGEEFVTGVQWVGDHE